MKKNKKLLALVCCMALLVGTVGATLAWLTMETQEVTNTFTVGNINIELKETGATDLTPDDDKEDQDKSYKMIPGKEETKDPTVTVKAGSEACWVFVKVEKTNNFDTFMESAIASPWKELSEGSGVYYIDQADLLAEDAEDAVYPVLKDNKVTVRTNVTKDMMDALNEEGATLPSISFKAYAIQKHGFDTAEAAWTEASK